MRGHRIQLDQAPVVVVVDVAATLAGLTSADGVVDHGGDDHDLSLLTDC